MIIDCFQIQNLKNSQMSCLVTAVLEITECFSHIYLLELMGTFLRSAQDQVGITFCPKVTIGQVFALE